MKKVKNLNGDEENIEYHNFYGKKDLLHFTKNIEIEMERVYFPIQILFHGLNMYRILFKILNKGDDSIYIRRLHYKIISPFPSEMERIQFVICI